MINPSESHEAPLTDAADVLYFAMHEWSGTAQRSHHLAAALAKYRRVFYINPCYYSAVGYARDALRGHPKRRRLWGVEYQSALTVVSFPPLFPKGALIPPLGRLNYRLLLPLMRSTFRQLGIANPILWLTTPPDHVLIGAFGERLSVYDCMDRHGLFYSGTIRRAIEQEEITLLGKVDQVFASASALVEHCQQVNANVSLIRNGVPDTFGGAPCELPPAAQHLNTLDAPVIGFIGYFGAWVDAELLVKISRAFPDARLVLVGTVGVDVDALRACPNIEWMGEQPHAVLPAFLQRFDVCLIPFKQNELTRAVNPIKLYEYLAAGKPIVCSDLPEMAAYRAVVYPAASHDEFLDQIRRAMQDHSAENARMRQQIAAENTWDQRAKLIESMFAKRQHSTITEAPSGAKHFVV